MNILIIALMFLFIALTLSGIVTVALALKNLYGFLREYADKHGESIVKLYSNPSIMEKETLTQYRGLRKKYIIRFLVIWLSAALVLGLTFLVSKGRGTTKINLPFSVSRN